MFAELTSGRISCNRYGRRANMSSGTKEVDISNKYIC